jgi:hypothetical protein
MPTAPTWSLVYFAICNAELGETGLAEATLARLKSSYPRSPDMTLEDILKEEIFHEDPALTDRYRAILQRVDKQG